MTRQQKQSATRKKNEKGPQPPMLGAHFSIAGGLEKALFSAAHYGCPSLQIFTKNSSSWKEREIAPAEIDRFAAAREKTGIAEIASHTSYLINLASPDPDKHALSCRALEKELIRSSLLGIDYVVIHPGAHMGQGEKKGIRQIAASINRILSSASRLRPRLLLETTSGQGSGIGHRFEQLAEIIDQVEAGERIGVCLDTCHIHAAGYDIRTPALFRRTLTALDRTLGLGRLFMFHLNDAKKDLGSRVDRHEHIGRGSIGPGAFRLIMTDARLKRISKIIETPKREGPTDWDRINLDLLRSFVR